MFNIGMMELMVVLLVAFLVVGPKDLPKVARWIARMIRKARSYVDGFSEELGLDELKKSVEGAKQEMKQTVSDVDVSAELRAAQEELRRTAEGVDVELRRTEADVKQAME